MEVGEEDIYPPPPSFVDEPFDSADPTFTTALDPAIPAIFRDTTPYSQEEPWGIMEGETDRQYQLFSYYRSLGLARTKGEVVKHFRISTNHIYKTAKENDWDARCRAWDMTRERLYTLELMEETREMAKAHGNIARKGVLALASVFEALVSRMEEDPERWADELAEMSTKQMMLIAQRSAQVIPNLMNAERLSRGMPTELVATHATADVNVNVQTTDDLAAILSGLFGAIGPGRNGDGSEGSAEIVDAVVVDDGSGEDPPY
jgi:hypothetical protein